MLVECLALPSGENVGRDGWEQHVHQDEIESEQLIDKRLIGLALCIAHGPSKAEEAPAPCKGQRKQDYGNERTNEKIVVVVELDDTAERHHLEKVEREDAKDADEVVVCVDGARYGAV